MTTQNEKTDYLSEWPAHYYEIEDINERERILKLAIEQKLDPARDEKRLLVLKKRFGEKQAEKRADHFLHAWMMIQATGAGGVSFSEKKTEKRTLRVFFAVGYPDGGNKKCGEGTRQRGCLWICT